MQYKLLTSMIVMTLFASYASTEPGGMKRMKHMDQDKNGQINFQEFSKRHLERFTSLDKNQDGTISQEEFLVPVSTHFERIDSNSNGAIEKEEIKKAMKKSMRNKKNKLGKHRNLKKRNFSIQIK